MLSPKKQVLFSMIAVLLLTQPGCMTLANKFENDGLAKELISPESDILVLPWGFGVGLGACSLLPIFPVTAPVSTWLVGGNPGSKSPMAAIGAPFYLNYLFGDFVGSVFAAPFWPLHVIVLFCDEFWSDSYEEEIPTDSPSPADSELESNDLNSSDSGSETSDRKASSKDEPPDRVSDPLLDSSESANVKSDEHRSSERQQTEIENAPR